MLSKYVRSDNNLWETQRDFLTTSSQSILISSEKAYLTGPTKNQIMRWMSQKEFLANMAEKCKNKSSNNFYIFTFLALSYL